MVDIAQPITANTHVSKNAPHVRLPYMIEVKVTAEQMIAAKGGAIAAADVYDLVKVPPQTAILHVWLKKDSAFAGTSADLTLDVGYTGGDTDQWVDGWDFDAAAVGSFATPVGVGAPVAGTVTNAVQTVSLLVATQTGTWTSGGFRVYLQCVDLSNEPHAGIVQLRT